jgi:alkylation response protein AidB-like acyl-CoA dehydrogenase
MNNRNPNQSKLIAQLHELGKEAESLSAQIQKNRYLPDDLVKRLKETGAFRLWVSKDYGGAEAHVLDLMEAVQTLSYYNGSLGWVLGVTGTAGLGSGYLKPEAAQQIFGSQYALTGGWAAPAGRAKKVTGGLQVSGKWSWGSGIRHCTHIVGGVLIDQGKDKRPISALAFFDPKEVKLIDNWDVLGLHGTNSIDYQVDKLFVPDGNWIYFPVQKAELSGTLYRFSFLGALASGVASVALGLAKRAIDEIILLSQSKVPNGAKRSLADRPNVQEKVAKMQATYQSAKLFLEDSVAKNWEAALQDSIPIKTKSELRLAATYAVSQAADVVTQAYRIGGGSSIWQGVKVQELLRDMSVATQHGMISPNNYEIAGRIAFDLKVNEWLL